MDKSNCKELDTHSMPEIYDTTYEPQIPIVENFLYGGTYLFVGAPKVGKSFFMAQLSYHVAMGLPLWGNKVHQSTVLYLALEDTHARLQERLYCMFGVESAEKLHFAIKADDLSSELIPQLNYFLKKYPDTKLIIIDTLQKIRPHNSDGNSYKADYDNVTQLKSFTDEHHICMFLVHHTRKMESDDSFDMISGTSGLLGAADGAFVLQRKKRTGLEATMDATGRDQQDMRYKMAFDPERHAWNLIETETELWREPIDPIQNAIMEAVNRMLSAQNLEWQGTATELLAQLPELDYLDLAPNSLVRRLNIANTNLFNRYGISYTKKHCHERRIIFKKVSDS
nr:AAA family ATPase [uncultured Acetatifactor sp.]